ncbi:hypothetical protein DV738_g821, partial [Chaetothyriales sp. CBS 135597]
MSGANYLKNLRRGDLNEIATVASLPNASSYKTKEDLAPALDEHLRANTTRYAYSDHKLIGAYYSKTGLKSRTPAKTFDVIKSDDEQAAVVVPKPRRRKTVSAPADDTVRPADRRSSTILQQTQEAVAVSPARVAAAFESQVSTVKTHLSDALGKLHIPDYVESVRGFTSTPLAIALVAGFYEASSVTRVVIPLKHLHDLQLLSYGPQRIWVPDLFVLLEYNKFWEPALVWLLSSVLLPLFASYLINIPWKVNSGHSHATRRATSHAAQSPKYDLFVFFLAKALFGYLVYAEQFQYFGIFTRLSTVIVNESFYDNYRNVLTTSAIGAAITLYEAVLHKMALPLPGSPASSWRLFGERLKHTFHGADPRVCIAFWLLGLINNVLYVIILSAALDLVGPNVPKGVVLLADVVPSFFAKLLAPYFIHVVPYSIRVLAFALLSATGMFLIALTPAHHGSGAAGATDATVATKMVGVMLASLSSGGGELTFLGLVHYYGPFSLAAWGSGTGGAGLIGAGAYALATTTMGFSVERTLLASAFLPVVMLVSFFVVLPLGPLKKPAHSSARPGWLDRNTEGLLADENIPKTGFFHAGQQSTPFWAQFWRNVARAKALFWPFMFPLLLVYIAEYTINQGVAPTLLFPLKDSPFNHFRAFYPFYNAIYQAGVFISRSSTPFFRIHNLYLPSFLQVGNLVLLTAQALFNFIPSVYIVFAVIFWEGLLGGLVYVNTFAEISDSVATEAREFSLSATSVSDSGGICIAGFISMAFEVWLCKWQVRQGRDYCTKL